MKIASPTAPAPVVTVKSMLARLLATENISVEHGNVQTAAFDLRTRTLILPRWKDMSNALYDMLVGHEVSHALFTPQDGWTNDSRILAAKHGVSESVARQYLNIAEDARIERLIKDKFPGLRSDFYKGYGELHAKNFFGVTDAQIPSLSLGDRVNLHSKLGLHVDAIVPFTADEVLIRDFVMGAKTWADTVTGADRMLTADAAQWQKQNETEMAEDGEPQGDTGGEPQDGGEAADGSDGEPQSSQDESDRGGNGSESGESESPSQDGEDSTPGKPQDSTEEGKGSAGKTGATKGISNPMGAPVTNAAFENAMKGMTETSAKCPDIVRAKLNAPTADVIVPFATVLKDWETIVTKQRIIVKPLRNADYTRASGSMATAFDRRKAADVWKRTTVAKTGSIDALRMNQYKWNEDIFRRATRIADGKNHGIVILLDWSSSMTSIMQSTIGQLTILTDFCRTAGIPFEVYAFTDQPYYTLPEGMDPYCNEAYELRGKECRKWENKTHNFAAPGHVRLLNFLSSRMTAPQYERMKSLLWGAWGSVGYDYRYRMGSTPTTAALHNASAVVADFIKRNRIQIAHTIVLTDGEPTDCYDVARDADVQRREGYYARKHYVLEDSVTGASYDMTDSCYYGSDGKPVHVRRGTVQWGEYTENRHVAIAIDCLRRRTGSKVHWIGLTDRQSKTVPSMGGFRADENHNWGRDGYVRGTAAAWDSAVIVSATRFSGGNNDRYIEKAMDKIEEKIESAKTTRTLFNAVAEKQAMTNSLRSLSTLIGEYLAV